MTLLSCAPLKQRAQTQLPERPVLLKLQSQNLVALNKALAKYPRDDGYARSASYYAMTGRKGLWLYSADTTFMMVAAHPNKNDHLLLFPPMGDHPADLLKSAVGDPRLKAAKVQLARMGAEDNLFLAWAEIAGGFKIEPETALDWAYPVHTMSTHQLAEPTGRRFRNFRHGLNLANNAGLTSVPMKISQDQDRAEIFDLMTAWAKQVDYDDYSTADLTGPVRMTLKLMENTDLPLEALLIRQDGKPSGYIIWEATHPDQNLANTLCALSLGVKGGVEYAYHEMAKRLTQKGFDYVCDGGSETQGLDAFKRKMNPVRSTALQSAFLV